MPSERRASGERQPRSRNRLLVVLRWALLGLPLALGIAYLSRERWLAPWLIARAQAWARADQGADLGIERLSGSWLGDVRLLGVSWTAPSGPLRRVVDGRVDLSFSPWALLRGRADGIAAIEVRAAEIELSTEAAAPRAPAPDGEDGPAGIPSRLAVRLDIERLAIRTADQEPFPFEAVHLQAALEAGSLRVAALEVRSGSNHLTLSEGEVPLDQDSVEGLLRHSHGRVSLAVPNAAELWPVGSEPWPVEGADLVFELVDGRAEVAGRCDFTGGSVAIEEGSISIRGQSSLLDARLDLVLQARVDDLAALGERFDAALIGRWEGRIDVHGSPRHPIGRFVGLGQDLVIDQWVVDSAELDLMTDGRRATLAAAGVRGPGIDLDLSGGMAFRPLAFEDLALEGRITAASVLSSLPFECRAWRGSARLTGPVAHPGGRFDASIEGAVLGGREWREVRARGTLDGDRATLEDLNLATEDGRIEASGWVAGWDSAVEGLTGELETLRVQWKEAHCELVEPAQFSRAKGRLLLDQVVLAGEQGRARIDLELGGQDPRAVVAFEAFEARALAGLFVPAGWEVGPVDGNLRVSLADGEATATADLIVGGVRWTGDPAEWRLGLKGALNPTGIAIESLSAHSSTGDVVRASLTAPFDVREPTRLAPGPVRMDLSIEVEDMRSLTERLQGLVPPLDAHRLDARSHLEGTWERLAGTASLHLSEFVLPDEAGLLGPCELRIEGAASEGAIEVTSADFVFAQGRAAGEGTLARPIDVIALRERRDEWLQGALAAEVRLDLPDFGGLERMAGVRRASGRVEGRLTLAGTAAKPRATGGVAWRDGELRLTAESTPIRSISADLVFEDGLVRLQSASGELGGAPLQLSGTVDPRGAVPVLNLRVGGQNILLLRTERLRLRADAELEVTGPMDAILVKGDLILTEGRFTGEFRPLQDLLRAGRATSGKNTEERVVLWSDPPLANARFDVRVRAANAFRVDTNLLVAHLRPDCRLAGTGAVPSLVGPIYIEDATLLLPSGKMHLSQGVLEFRSSAPFRPQITLTAEQQTQGYAVRAVVTGSLEEYEITLSSTPPLSSDDLWVLVLTGQPPLDRWQDRSAQAMQSLALFLARDQIVRWFTRDPDAAESLLERFEIEVGAKTSISGQATGRVLFYLRPRAPNSGRATYLSAEVDRYDRANYALGIVFRPR